MTVTRDNHPGIVLRPGPTGDRAALTAGPDVSEVVAALHAIQTEAPDRCAGQCSTTDLRDVTGLSDDQITTALRYYREFPEEIDERIAANRTVAEREERRWHAQQTRPGDAGS